MKTLSYPEYGRLEIAEQETPPIAPDEVLLRVAACGLCGSELETFKTRSPRRQPPLVMGHEFCGVIEAVGAAATGWAVGGQAVSNSLVSCGECVRCCNGRTHLCASRQIFGMHRNGAFAEYVNVPARCLLRWPDGLSAELAALAEPLANGVHMVKLSRHLEATKVFIIGAGPIGLLAKDAFRALRGSEVWMADLSAERRDAALRTGAARVFDPRTDDVVETLRDATRGEGADIVVDAVGAGITKRQSIELLRPGGAAIWIGLHEDALSLDSYQITLPEKQVLGTYAATQDEMQTALDLLAQGQVDASWLQSFALTEGVDAFHKMLAAHGADIKAVITP
jgi:L-iditol 2-dehydrogenase